MNILQTPQYIGCTLTALVGAYALIALSAGGWWTIFPPIIMTYLLVRVSGVAMLEKTMKMKPSYEDYARKTSAFIPWLTRK